MDCIFITCSDTYREVINQQIKKAGGRPFDIPNWEGMVEQMLTLHEYVTKVEMIRLEMYIHGLEGVYQKIE